MINIDEKEDRKNYIGGIDAPVIVLPNPKWKTKYQLWLEKTGRVEPKDISDKPEVEFGILQEEVVRKKFIKDTGYEVVKPEEAIYHPQYSFIGAHFDGLGVDEEGNQFVFEAKTSPFGKGWENDSIPPDYQIQVAHYLMVADAPYSYIAVLISGCFYHCYKIYRDYELEKEILEREIDFWENYVLKDIPPELTTIEDFNYIEREETIAEAEPETKTLIKQYQDLQSAIKELEEQKEALKLEIIKAMGTSEYLKADNVIVRYQKVESSTLDTKKFRAELPHIAEKYLRKNYSYRLTFKEAKNE